MLEEVLTEEGYEVITHNDLRDAHEFLRQHGPAVAILDLLQSHRLIGLDVLRQVKGDPEARGLRVIVVSADAPGLRLNATELRMYGVMAVDKPYSLDELLSVIREALRRDTGTEEQSSPA